MAELRQTHFPYCLLREPDGTYVVVNRRYKPIGFCTDEWIDYGAHPVRTTRKLSRAAAAKLDCDGRTGGDRIYLYNDGCIPTSSAQHMQSYLERLAVLMRVRLESASE
ncbi:hypothetical protein [Algiphilus sp.]|uniref:hypothetical protein n=1 Tax=Algiphilus sp. TaxID=1872431 RepID=UPI0025C0F40F|nr:hypothetical protein [Algiphilus sp.]MCK5770916.1 hypothetical protein [Algiphilus sp.]